jgi:HrpA-like RNA helicase
LYVHLLSHDRWQQLPEKYAEKGQYRSGAEAQSLGWLRLQAVLNAVQDPTDFDSHRLGWTVGSRSWTSSPSQFLVTVLGSADVRRHLMEWLTPASVARQAESVQRLLGLPTAEFEQHFLRPEWRLKLESPVLPTPSAIKVLSKSSAEYKELVQELPPAQQQSLISLRQVDVLARQAIFAQALGKGKIQKPLYHGTPERWRATSIAAHGFDLKLRLNGRALGDGIYTASNVGTPLGYTGGTGSILRLQGVEGAPNVHGTVFVFPKPETVLPTHIFDFATTDKADQDASSQIVDEEAIKIQLAKDQARLAQMEADYKQACLVHHRKACVYFHQRVTELQQAASAEGTEPGLYHIQLEREARQFNSHLPIYAYKEEIVAALKSHTVLTFESGTGSGKSTQLPQYLLDEVLDAADRRRVGVLQPRRINVTQLCKRVAEERAGQAGVEVGYRMGRGAVLTSEATRLEFMTHGLFVTMAASPEQVLTQYAAIVLDEAHERSVEIDLSFAYLRNILAVWRTDPDKYGDFKVVVASATIQEQAEAFRAFLDPDNVSSTCYRMDQKPLSFPVLVQYRTDMHADPEVVGSRGAGAILTSHALQTAADILSATPHGDVLVFLPGESEVTACMQGLETLLKWGQGSVKGARVTEGLHWSDRTAPLKFSLPAAKDDDADVPSWRKFFKQRKSVAMAALPLYGKSVKAFEQHLKILSKERLIIFATNVAETGVTLRNVRYVVDTGLERSVTWNPRTELSEMVTQRCSQSSMQQRTGRAGRTMSGVCVRLFSEEVFDAAPANKAPEISSGMATSSLLRLRSVPSELPLLQALPEEHEAAAISILQTLGAMDEGGAITAHGRSYLGFGLNLRVARFLHACLFHGCGRRGAWLAAIMTLDAPAMLLPSKASKETPLSDAAQLFLSTFAHEAGDHMTLLQLIEAFRHCDGELAFATRYGVDLAVLHEVMEMHHYVLAQLSRLNEFDTQPQDDASDKAILGALCATYSDQLATEATFNRPQDGYLRLLTDKQSLAYRERIDAFAQAYMPAPATDENSDNGDNGDNGDDGDVQGAALQGPSLIDPEPEPGNDNNVCKMRLGHRSMLWHGAQTSAPSQAAGQAAVQPAVQPPAQQPESSRFVLFTDVILTDSTSGDPCPHLELVSFVTAEQVKENAKDWCDSVDFDTLAVASERRVQHIPLSDQTRKIILRSKGAFLRRVRSRFAKCYVGVEGGNEETDEEIDKQSGKQSGKKSGKETDKPSYLRISAPKTYLPEIVDFAQRKIKELEPETLTIPLPESVHMGKLIGKKGANREQLLSELRAMATGMSSDIELHDVYFRIDSERRVALLELRARAKFIADVVLGRLHNAIDQASDEPVHFEEDGANHRLRSLITRNPPVSPGAGLTRDKAMLAMAHFIVWQLRAAVYGGFVRDWVVSGQAANDIDVRIAPGASIVSLTKALEQEGKQYGLSLTGPRKKGAANTVTLSGDGGLSFEIDLVDPQAVPYSHPGVDSDVNNLVVQLDSQGQAELNYKVPKPALVQASPIPTTIEHIQNKEFIFYYDQQRDAGMAQRRIQKMQGKGYTMIKYLPQSQ